MNGWLWPNVLLALTLIVGLATVALLVWQAIHA